MPIAYAGYPGPSDFTFATGYVTSVKKLRTGINKLDFTIDVHAAPGSSGSPIISLDTGLIIGVLIEGVYAPRVGAFMVGVESVRSLDLCEGRFDSEHKPARASPF
jgi:V8-like Glu-specific endopeptidase